MMPLVSRNVTYPPCSDFPSHLSTPAIAFYFGSWWHALILIIAGFLTGFVLVMMLKSKIQPLIILGLPLLWILGVPYIFIVSE